MHHISIEPHRDTQAYLIRMCIAYISEKSKIWRWFGDLSVPQISSSKPPAFSLDLGQSWVIHGNSQIKWLSTWGPQRRPEMGDGKGPERMENHGITMKHKDWLKYHGESWWFQLSWSIELAWKWWFSEGCKRHTEEHWAQSLELHPSHEFVSCRG